MAIFCRLSDVATLVFVLGVLQGCYSLENTTITTAKKLILPEPISRAERGTDHAIYCYKNSSYPTFGKIAWYDIPEFGVQILMFLGDEKVNFDPKYSEFGIDYDSQYDTYSNLLIKNMGVSKEGTYGCSLEDEIHMATITMEVEVTAFYVQTPHGTTPDFVEGVEESIVQLVCKAIAARPALQLRWYHKEERDAPYTQITSGFQEVQSPNEQDSDTFDTTSDLRYNLYKSYNLGSIKCEATGQTAVALPQPVILTLVVQWLPEVHITYDREGTQIICNANANPVVLPEDFTLIVGGNRYSGQHTLIIEIVTETEVGCEASNSVGTGKATIVISAPSDNDLSLGAIIGICFGAGIFVVGCLIVLLVCKDCLRDSYYYST